MQVPEIEFQMPLDKKRPSEEALKQTAHTMAKINHLNDQKNGRLFGCAAP
jgi:hypothetical protein